MTTGNGQEPDKKILKKIMARIAENAESNRKAIERGRRKQAAKKLKRKKRG